MSDYWEGYESFNSLFKESERTEVSSQLEAARNLVNGMTDGWYEFLTELKAIQKSYSSHMSLEEKEKLTVMIKDLENHLRR